MKPERLLHHALGVRQPPVPDVLERRRTPAQRPDLLLDLSLDVGVPRDVEQGSGHRRRLRLVSRGHDVVHVPPELLVRVREVTLVILQVQHGVEQTHLLDLLAAVPLRLVHLPPLFHDVVAHLLERIVRVDELLQPPDAKLSAELEQGQRGDEHLAHDLRAPVVRLQHRVLRELAFAGDHRSRLVQQVERVVERDWRDDVEEEVLRVEIHVLHDALPWARLRGRHVERLDQVSHAVLHHGAERLEEVVVYERLLAHFPVLPVVFALRTGDAEVFEDEPEDVG